MASKSLAIMLLFIFFPSVSTYCLAEETAIQEEAELGRLLTILEKHTEIATRTKLNADYVPGMVTVLYGDELEARGVATVWEALGVVPGMSLYIENNGVRQVLARSIGDTFGSGNISFLLNNITANSTLFGTPYPLLDIPIFQVDRIEVIRGPGSAVYGEFANAAVVNIITRKDGRRVSGRYESFETFSGGGLFSWSNSEKSFRLSLNLAGMETDGADTITGPDTLYNFNGMDLSGISQAPGPANQDRRSKSGFLTLDFKDLTLLVQYIEEGHGDNFGVQDALAPQDDRIVATHKHWLFDARQRLNISHTMKADLSLGWQYFETDVHNMYLYPPGFPGFPPTFPGFPDGMIIGPHYERSKLRGGLDIYWEGWDKHSILLGWTFAKTKLTEGWQDSNFVPSSFSPTSSGEVERFAGSENIVEIGNDRTLHSLTLQDEYQFAERFTMTAGLRYDHYDDVGSAFSPRLAGVWRMTDHHLFKVQYARAFRPPTFLEMYAINQPIITGNANIDPAISDTYEISYIYNRPETTFRITPFYTDLKDLIVARSGTFSNTGSARLKGLEIELEQRLAAFLKFDANISYVKTEDEETDNEIANSVNWLANVGLVYSLRPNITLSILYKYVGDRNRQALDTREELDGYQTVDLTGNLFNLWSENLTLRMGVKNIFDEDISFPAYMNTYPDDYPQPGRWWWTQLSYEF